MKRLVRLALLAMAIFPALAGRASADGFVVLFSETEYGGSYVLLTRDTPKLALLDFDHRAASVGLVSAVTASLYSGEYYTGTCVVVRAGRGSLTDLIPEGVSSVRIGQDCVPRGENAPTVALYDAAGRQLLVSEDIPELGAIGFGARATEIELATAVNAPYAVALYSRSSYQGTCETFIVSQELAGTTIGASTARSIRVNYTCDGPVRSAPVVTGLDVAYSTVDDASAVCDSGFSREEQELNAGTHDAEDSSPGHYIHACLKYGPLVAGHTYLTDVFVGVVGDLQSWSSACYGYDRDDPIQISTNLNGGAGGEGLTFCYTQSSSDPAPPSASVVQDLGFISYPSWWETSVHQQRDCEASVDQTENVDYDPENLNAGTDFIGDDDSIFLCRWKPVHLFDSPNPYLFTPTAVKSFEDPEESDGTKVRYAVSAYDKEGTALTPVCSSSAMDDVGRYTLVPHGQTSATVSCTATDADGRTQTASFAITVTPAELVPPTITAAAVSNGQPYTGAWTRNNVTVTFTCHDAAGRPLDSVTPPATFSHDAIGGMAGGTCTDGSGQSAFTQFGPVNIDKTAPVVSGRVNGLPGPAWFNRPFQIVWQGQDALSGIDTCETTAYGGPETAAASRSGHCTDRAGNVGTGTFTFAYDATPPVVTAFHAPEPNAAGWNNTDVVVQAAGGDALSGIESCTRKVISDDGIGRSATVSCRDRAGNVGHATVRGINVDQTGPTVAAGADRPPGGNGWYRSPFTVTWTGQDALSGLAGCAAPSTYTGPDDAAGNLVGYCDDGADNRTVKAFPFRYDASAPQVAIVSAPAGPINAPATFGWTGTDALTAAGALTFRYRFSGSAVGAWSAFGPATKATFTPSAGGQYTLEVEGQDEAGNVSAAAVRAFTVDLSGPAIDIASPSDRATYVRFTKVVAQYSCSDAGAGMVGGACVGDVPLGSSVATETPGLHSFTVNASDALGNTATRSLRYEVVNPAPVVTGLTPAAVPAGPTKLAVEGTGFVPETTLSIQGLNGQALWWVGSYAVSADLTRIDLRVDEPGLGAGVKRLIIGNPGPGGGSAEVLLFVAPAGTDVSDADVSTDGSATVGGDGPGTPGSLSASGDGGPGTLVVAEYASNPAGGVSFASSGAFFDVYVAPGSTFTSVTVTACNLGGGNFVQWWDGAEWRLVSPQSFDAATGCVTITATDSSSPSLSQLTGTIFGAGIDSTPPATTAEATANGGPYVFGAWTSHAILVTLSAAEDPGGSGVARIAYRVDGGAEQTYGGPIALSHEGTSALEYWSEDRTGNVEPARTVAVRIDRTPPVLSLPPDQVLEATGPDGATFSYAAYAQDALTGPATPSCAPVTGSVFPLGATTVTCSATDPAGNTDMGSFGITVRDTTAPVIRNLTLPNGGVLWPANHRMVPLTMMVDATDIVSTPICTVERVISSEAADGLGEGDTSPDWQITGPLSVELRAERSGGGSGRTYTLTVVCADAAGNRSTATVTASVPHDEGKR